MTRCKPAIDHPNHNEDTNEARAVKIQPKNRTHTRAGRVVAGEMMLWMCALTVVVTSAIFTKEQGSLPALAQISPAASVEAEMVPVANTLDEAAYEVPSNPINEEAIARAIELTAEPAEIEPTDLSTRWFDGRQVRPVRVVYMTVTGYSPDARSCGKYADNKTAIMYSVWTNGMNLVAADPKVLPYKSLISVPGYAGSEIVPVMDCGGAIKGNRLDLLYPTHEMALQWGIRQLPVTIWEYVDENEG
jgi:3D (Asp-Asp-Asp) domain-containing protein